MVAVSVLPSTGFQKNAAHPFCCARSRMTVFAPGGRHDDRWRRACGAQPLLQLDARHAGKLDVDDDARGRRRRVDVGFRRLEEGRLESRCPEQTAQRCARRRIILDDGNDHGRLRLHPLLT